MSKQVLHDLRAIHDVVSLRAERLAAAAWDLVELRPDPYSGGAMTVGASVDGDTGKLIDDATGRELAARSRARQTGMPVATVQPNKP